MVMPDSTAVSVGVVCGQVQVFDQVGQSLLDDIPHDLPVHSKIVVDQTVAHSGYLRPFDLWMVRAKLRRQPFCRIAENLEVPNHRVLRPRSEEHTSELQSLMRISYAVIC